MTEMFGRYPHDDPHTQSSDTTVAHCSFRPQHAAFAYGERKLGRTDLAIMKIERL
jgi:hypothetical protein